MRSGNLPPLGIARNVAKRRAKSAVGPASHAARGERAGDVREIEVRQAGCNAKSGNKSFLDHFFGLGNRQEDTRKSLT
jgi:hypothetical protein